MSQEPINMPLVTACVPTYNSARFLSATLESLEAQNYPNLEVMISDDASYLTGQVLHVDGGLWMYG